MTETTDNANVTIRALIETALLKADAVDTEPDDVYDIDDAPACLYLLREAERAETILVRRGVATDTPQDLHWEE